MNKEHSRFKYFVDWWAFSIVLISLLLSVVSMPADLTWGDTPELAAASWNLGIPHPTGYPLFLVFTRMVQWIPVGTIVFRAHLASAILIAAACCILFWFNKELIQHAFKASHRIASICSMVAVLGFRLTSLVWEQAAVSEVYPMFILLFVLNLWILNRAWIKPTRYLPALFLILGLQLIHHRLAVFLVACTLVVVLIRVIQHPKQHPLFHYIISFLAPAAFLIYFPIRASWDPAINWFDPDTPTRLFQLLSGGQFPLILQNGITMLPYWLTPQTALQITLMPLAYYSFFSVIAILGLFALLWKDRLFGLFIPILFIIYLCFFAVYPVGDYMTFLLPCLILLSPLTAAGTALFLHTMHRKHIKKSVILITAAGFAGIALTPSGISVNQVSTLMPVRAPVNQNTRSQINSALFQPDWKQTIPNRLQQPFDTSATDYANQVFSTIPRQSPIITGLSEANADNELNPILYQKVVERRHPQTPIIGAGFLMYDWYRRQLNNSTSLYLEMRDNAPMESRNAWLDNVWQTIITPMLSRGPVYTTSYPLPEEWHDKATITTIKQIDLDRSSTPNYYRAYLPKGYILKIERNPQPAANTQ